MYVWFLRKFYLRAVILFGSPYTKNINSINKQQMNPVLRRVQWNQAHHLGLYRQVQTTFPFRNWSFADSIHGAWIAAEEAAVYF